MKRRIVGDIVGRPGRIVQIAPEATVREAAVLMERERVGALLVTRDGRLMGLFSERDALNRVLARRRDPDRTAVSEAMTEAVTVIDPGAGALEALRLLRDGGFRHLPVVEEGTLRGMVSLRDFFGVELAEIEHEIDFQAAIAEGSSS